MTEIAPGTRLPRPDESDGCYNCKCRMEKRCPQRREATGFKKHYPHSEIIRVQFMEKKCFVQVEEPILEYSSNGRLQFHHEGRMTKYILELRNRSEIAEA